MESLEMREDENKTPEFFDIPSCRFEYFKKKFNHLIKKAKKTKSEIPTFTSEEIEKKVNLRKEKYYRVYVTGCRPRIEGYEFLATIEHNKEMNIIKTFNNDLDFSSYVHAKSYCGHCSTNRRRNKTFLLRDESGEMIQVGSSCLVDFLGHASPEYYAALASIIFEMRNDDESEWRGIKREYIFPIEEVLEVALIVVEIDGGYKTAAAHGFGATSHQVIRFLESDGLSKDANEDYKTWYRAVEEKFKNGEYRNKAKEVSEYHKNIETGDSTFKNNLKALALKGQIEGSDFGLTCYMVQNYFDFEKKKAKWMLEKEELAKKSNEHVGEIKKRMDFEKLTYMGTNVFSGFYGDVYFNQFEDEKGNLIVNKSTRSLASMAGKDGVDIGETFNLKGTITKHEAYKGRKQTIINRVTIKKT